MASSGEAFHTDADATTPLIGVGQVAPEAPALSAAAPMVRTPLEESKERYQRVIRVPPKPFPWWRRLPFLGPDINCIEPGQPLDEEQFEMLSKSGRPGYFERVAMGRQLAAEILERYNAMHPEDEFEVAPGEVTNFSRFDKGIHWTHGNFVARRKRSGYCSFLPAPRTLFFFEVAYSNDCESLVTCTPLDEPVTEAYSVLGIPLWCSKRRSGKLDTICMRCSRRFDLSYTGILEVLPCGHDYGHNARGVCKMCYRRSIVLHPEPEAFRFGCSDPHHPN